MDTQVERVLAWREQKRRDGFQPLTVWLKAEIKHQIEDVAAQRRQDLGQVITEAIVAYYGAGPTVPFDVQTVSRLIDERLAALAPRLGPPPPSSDEQPASPVPLARPPGLSRGEYGEVAQAVRRGAQALQRFTNNGLARHIDRDPRSVASSVKRLVQKGALRKQGTLYFWVGDAAAAAEGSTPRRGGRLTLPVS
jgi:hypothetical protein